LTEQSTL